jgi:hypothetical protein
MKPHKHAELIKAWADGHTIEMFTADGCWMEVTHPSWMRDMEYRIRKEPKKDWIGLTYEDMIKVWNDTYKGGDVLPTTFALAIEAKLKEKNSG